MPSEVLHGAVPVKHGAQGAQELNGAGEGQFEPLKFHEDYNHVVLFRKALGTGAGHWPPRGSAAAPPISPMPPATPTPLGLGLQGQGGPGLLTSGAPRERGEGLLPSQEGHHLG